jgi:6-pyruvoyltetrahydropterin/6-carboxytetrahydropterin synthase
MFTISKSFSFCYGHRLLGDKGKCKNLHGHTARAVVFIESRSLDEQGMVCHFDRLKVGIGKWINENLDHAMLLSKNDPAADALKKIGERIFVMDENPTAENIAKLIYEKVRSEGNDVSRVEVWESETAKAIFTPK